MKSFLILMALVWSQVSNAQSTCSPHTSILYTSLNVPVGNISISNDSQNMIFNVNADAVNGWRLSELQIYAGIGPIPVLGGSANYEQFSYVFFFPDLITSLPTFIVPQSEVFASCGTSLNISIRARLFQLDSGGNVLGEDIAYAFGPNVIASIPSEWWFPYTVCCENSDPGCTLTQGYYKTHNSFGKKSQNIPWLISENTLLCGKRWYDIIKSTPKSGDAWTILAQQWITTKLNIALGASMDSVVSGTVTSSETMLTSNCSTIPKAQKSLAAEYTGVLQSYNNGETGPGLCQ